VITGVGIERDDVVAVLGARLAQPFEKRRIDGHHTAASPPLGFPASNWYFYLRGNRSRSATLRAMRLATVLAPELISDSQKRNTFQPV
jgi:hypothetical protein